MAIVYKLTDSDGYTQKDRRRETKWELDKEHVLVPKEMPQLCSPDVFHAYLDPDLALLLNPIHAKIENPTLWEAQGEVVVEDWGKVGCFKLTITKQLELPDWDKDADLRQNVSIHFAVLCAEAVLTILEAQRPDDNRPRKAIEVIKVHLKDPAFPAAYDVSVVDAARAADAAYAAVYADAARAARAADARAAGAAASAASAVRAAAYAAGADAARAARAAAYAAYAAGAAAGADAINFIVIAQTAVRRGTNTELKGGK